MTCLVVDDSRTLRIIVCNMLRSLGFDTVQAENGAEALSLCEAGMPDCIILDWNMPVMDGPTFLKALRARPDGAAPRVLFCTTENDLERISYAMDLGADEYIMKPFDDAVLASKLNLLGLLEGAEAP